MRKVGLSLLVVLAVSGFFWVLSTQDFGSGEAAMSAGSNRVHSVEEPGEVADPVDAEGVAGSLAPKKGGVIDQLQEVRRVSNVNHQIANRAFSGEVAMVDAVEEISMAEGWGVDRIASNLSMWRDLCFSANQSPSGGYLFHNEQQVREVQARATAFCRGFDEQLEDDYHDLADGASGAGVSTLSGYSPTELESRRAAFGADAVFGQAIADIDAALRSFDFAGTMEILWAIGHSDILEPPVHGKPQSHHLYDGYVILGLATLLVCQEVGGCDGTHPLTQQICRQSASHMCLDPRGPWDAFVQTHSGLQIVALERFYMQVSHRLSRYRAAKSD